MVLTSYPVTYWHTILLFSASQCQNDSLFKLFEGSIFAIQVNKKEWFFRPDQMPPHSRFPWIQGVTWQPWCLSVVMETYVSRLLPGILAAWWDSLHSQVQPSQFWGTVPSLGKLPGSGTPCTKTSDTQSPLSSASKPISSLWPPHPFFCVWVMFVCCLSHYSHSLKRLWVLEKRYIRIVYYHYYYDDGEREAKWKWLPVCVFDIVFCLLINVTF